MNNPDLEPILKVKIQPPATPPLLVERPRLAAKLEAGRAATKLSLVAAPAGFGKTTVVHDWLNRTKPGAAVAWFSIGDQDDNPPRFWRYLLASLDAGLGLTSERFLRLARFEPGHNFEAEQVVTRLLNDFATLNQPVILVLDDYHRITSPEIHQGLTFLLDHQPSGLHVVITCRNEPPLPLTRLRVRGQLTELHRADLQFSLEEATALLNSTTGLNLLPRLVAKLESKTEGWAAALQLSALLLQNGRDFEELTRSFTGQQRFMLDYLGEEVFQPQPAAIKNFLLQTSVVESLNAALAEELTGCEDGQAMLDRVLGANLFLIKINDLPGWYRYHYLFRQYLYSHLEQTQAEILPLLHRAAARWYEEQGQPHLAIEHALQGQDYTFAVGLIEQSTAELYRQSDLKTLGRWLSALPREIVNSYLHTSLNLGWVLALTERAHLAGTYLEAAAALVEKSDLTPAALKSLRGELAGIGAFIERKQGNFGKALTLGEQALSQLDESQNFFRCAVTLNQGHCQADLDNLKEAARYYIQTERAGRAIENAYFGLLGRVSLARLYWQFGQLNLALATAQRALELAEAKDFPALALAYLVQGGVWRERNNLADAAANLESALNAAEGNIEDGTLEILLELALLRHAEGDSRAASNYLHKAQALIYNSNQPVLFRKFDHVTMRLHLSAGNLDAVEAWQAQLEYDEAVIPNYLLEIDRILEVRRYLAQGRFDPALELAKEITGKAQAKGYLNIQLESLGLHSAALYLQGQRGPALQIVNEAWRLAEPQKFRRVFLDSDEVLPALLAKVAEPRQNQFIITGPATVESVSNRLRPILPEPLTEREAEVLKLLVNTTLSSTEIADQLVVAVSTVRSHIKSIYGKLEVQNRLSAIVRARELDLVMD